MDKQEMKKALAMKEKTKKIRRDFNLPDSEDVIQDYFCTWGIGKGRLYITQNYVCWASDLTSVTEKIPFRLINSIKQTTGILGKGITIEGQQQAYSFGSLVHRGEAYNLLKHLWENPPTIVNVSSLSDSSPSISSSSGSSPPARGFTAPSGGSGIRSTWTSTTSSSSSAPTSPFITNRTEARTSSPSGSRWGGGQAQKLTAKDVDTEASERALRIALEARDMGVATMEELEYQAAQIDRIEDGIENIHANLDKGERLIRGIESLGGHVMNGLTSEKKAVVRERQNRELSWRASRPNKVDIPILLKHKNCFLSPATLHFDEGYFACLEEGKSKSQRWSYDTVDRVIVRARPLHLDIRFVRDERFRLCSALIQPIVNEFYFRVPGCKIVFEADVRKFDYGSADIVAESKSRGEGGGRAAFFGVRKTTADLLSNDVDEEVVHAVKKQEEHVEQITHLVSEMGQIGLAMGDELDRQNVQITHVTARVEQANERLHNNSNRIDRML